jgi:hypothetical protein
MHPGLRAAFAVMAGAALFATVAPTPVNARQSKSSAQKKKKPAQKKPAGGANQVEGLNGTVGQMLFTGRWRFQVKDVQQVDTYTLKVPTSEQDYGRYHTFAEFDLNTKTFKPLPGNTLVAVSAILKNAQTKTQQLGSYLGDPKTALTDTEGGSYPPIAYDMQSQGAWVTKKMLPGSALNMTILFAIPKDTKLKDLVVSLYNWDDMKGKEVRISLPK